MLFGGTLSVAVGIVPVLDVGFETSRQRSDVQLRIRRPDRAEVNRVPASTRFVVGECSRVFTEAIAADVSRFAKPEDARQVEKLVGGSRGNSYIASAGVLQIAAR
jgi:hypothetical protein